jgi:hypothetical protein
MMAGNIILRNNKYMNKVLFLDIDGVVLPSRAYHLPNQTKPIVKIFDPCAVSLINKACNKQKRKIVIHSSWILTGLWNPDNYGTIGVLEHCISQGFDKDVFHSDAYCNRNINNRYLRITDWLHNHPEVDDYFILDDEKPDKDFEYHNKHLILTDFDEGLTMKHYYRISDGIGTK